MRDVSQSGIDRNVDLELREGGGDKVWKEGRSREKRMRGRNKKRDR